MVRIIYCNCILIQPPWPAKLPLGRFTDPTGFSNENRKVQVWLKRSTPSIHFFLSIYVWLELGTGARSSCFWVKGGSTPTNHPQQGLTLANSPIKIQKKKMPVFGTWEETGITQREPTQTQGEHANSPRGTSCNTRIQKSNVKPLLINKYMNHSHRTWKLNAGYCLWHASGEKCNDLIPSRCRSPRKEVIPPSACSSGLLTVSRYKNSTGFWPQSVFMKKESAV